MGSSRLRMASAAVAKYASSRSEVPRSAHVHEPAIPCQRIDREREVACPQARVPALGAVRARTAPVLGEEQGQASAGRSQVHRIRVEGEEHGVGRDPGIEPVDEGLEEGHAADGVVEGWIGHGCESSEGGVA
jgi:hypothetical protein